MDTPRSRVLSILEKMSKGVVIFLSGIVLCFFSITGLMEKASIVQSERETCVFVRHGFLFFALLLLGVVLLLCARNFIAKINSRILFCVLSVFYLAAGMYLIINADPAIRADAELVYQSALDFNQGIFSFLETGGYLARYPQQLGMVTYERIFMIFSSSVRFFFALNLLMVFIINYMQWKISGILSANNIQAVNYTIIFSFAFLPQLFFVLFVYGLIPGFCCLICAVYFTMRYFQTGDLRDAVFSIVLTAVSCTLRKNFLIAAIAIFFLYLLDYFRSEKKRCLLIALVTVVCAVMLPRGVNIWYQHESGIDFEAETPMVLFVTMGLQDSHPYRMGGWYNAYVAAIPAEYGYNFELAQERGLTDLQERLNYFKENPEEAFHFFKNKVKSTWLDPLFQSIWSGPLEDCGQYMQTKLLSDLYTGKGIYSPLTGCLNVVLVIVYFMSLLYIIFAALIEKSGLTCEKLFPCIFLLGGFFFHLVWETKSQYVYPYVFMLIPMAALGVKSAGDRLMMRRNAKWTST